MYKEDPEQRWDSCWIHSLCAD